MISAISEFKLFYRGFKATLILIPGWATDYRIFSNLNLNYNYLLPIRFYPFRFHEELGKFLNKNSLDKITLFGWSLGGFLATEFALRYSDRIDELILLNIRKRFDYSILKEIEIKLKRSKSAYLYKFYLDCFSQDDKEGLNWFKRYLLDDYINKIKLENLIEGLDYLSQIEINPEFLTNIKRIRIFHGEDDKIVPIKESRAIKSGLPKAKFISLQDLGHIPFLNPRFKIKFYNG